MTASASACILKFMPFSHKSTYQVSASAECFEFGAVIEKGTWCVGVVIPAHNEETHVTRCIESVRAAADACKRLRRLWIVVAADMCTDATVRNAQAALEKNGEVIACQCRSAGAGTKAGRGGRA